MTHPLQDVDGKVVADYRALARGEASPEPRGRSQSPTRGAQHQGPPPAKGSYADAFLNGHLEGGAKQPQQPPPPQQPDQYGQGGAGYLSPPPGGGGNNRRSPDARNFVHERTTGDGAGLLDQQSRDNEAATKNLSYQDFLRAQVQEKKDRIAAEKEKERLEEEKEAKRVEAERVRLAETFEAEKQKQIEKEERIKAENAARVKEAEEKRKFATEQQAKSPSPKKSNRSSPARPPPAEGDGPPWPNASSPTPATYQRAASPPIPTKRAGRKVDAEEDPFNQKQPPLPAMYSPPPPSITVEQSSADLAPTVASPRQQSRAPSSPPLPAQAKNAPPRQASPPLPAQAAASVAQPPREGRRAGSASSSRSRPSSARSRPTSARTRPPSSRTRPTSSKPRRNNASSRGRPPRAPGSVQPTALEQQLVQYEQDVALLGQNGAPAATVRMAYTDRERTTELEDNAAAELHDSVHDQTGQLAASLRAATHSLPSSPPAMLPPRPPGNDASRPTSRLPPSDPQSGLFDMADVPKVDVSAKSELMGQLSSLRKRLEGEQRKITRDISINKQQYSALADQSRRRKAASSRVNELDNVMMNANLRLTGGTGPTVTMLGGAVSPGSGPRAELSRGGTGGLERAVDESALRTFSKLKYNTAAGSQDTSAKKMLISAYPTPPMDSHDLDEQQRAMLEVQSKEIRDLRKLRVAEFGAVDRAPTLESFNSFAFDSLNIDDIAAKNDARMKRLNASASVQAATSADPDQILKDFLGGAAAAGNLELETETLFREGTNSTINA